MNTLMENANTIIAVAEELLQDGQIWVNIDGEMIYIPELIEQIRTLQDHNTLNA